MKAETNEFGAVRLTAETEADREALDAMHPPNSIVVQSMAMAVGGGVVHDLLIKGKPVWPRWMLEDYLKEARARMVELLGVLSDEGLEETNVILVEETKKLVRLLDKRIE